MNSKLNAASIKGELGAGSLILNDYALNITQIERGYRLAVTRGSEVQTMDVLDGVGIVGIEKTGSTGDMDSYRVSFTDGSTFGYTVETNAATYAAAEAARVEAENSRVSAEAERVAAEAVRVNAEDARVAGEAARESAEAARTSAESARAQAEDGRQSAEAERVAAEQSRVSAESARAQAEDARVAAETARANAENERAGAETLRAAEETDRANAESGRVSAEQERVSAESERVAAEEARATEFAGFSGEITQLKDDVAAITPDDTVVDGKPWTSKKIVDTLCSPLEASGNPVQCHPVAGYPLGVVSRIEPVQAGSGDPSPNNIRPIVGWDSVSVTRCGKNLFSVGSANIFIDISGQETPIVGSVTTPKIPCKAGDKFILTCKNTFVPAPGNVGVVAFYDASDALLQRISNTHTNNITSTAPENAYYVLASCYAPTEADEIVFELGSTATPYEPYTGDTYNIALPETVYGGTLDLETGVVTVDRAIDVKTSGDIREDSAGIQFVIPAKYASAIAYYSPSNCMNGFLHSGSFYRANKSDTGYETLTELQGALGDTPIQLCYKLATPYSVQLTPQQIAALSGVNTLYTDSGDISVSGRTDMIWLTQSLIDRIAALETAAVSE